MTLTIRLERYTIYRKVFKTTMVSLSQGDRLRVIQLLMIMVRQAHHDHVRRCTQMNADKETPYLRLPASIGGCNCSDDSLRR
jgi:hypothetical protein